MEWKDVGRLIAPFAPLAGSIIADLIPLPIPGKAAMGRKLGELVAGAFGVAPTPEAVSTAVTNAGRDEVIAKVNAAVEQARVQVDGFVAFERAILEAQVKNLSDVNATIRVEAGERARLLLAGIKEHWFFTGWRPFFGWVFGTVYLAFGLMLTLVTFKTALAAVDPLAVLQSAWPLFLSYFGPGGLVLGVLIPSRSAEKVAAINADAPPPIPQRMPPRMMPQPAPAPASARPPVTQRVADPPGSRT